MNNELIKGIAYLPSWIQLGWLGLIIFAVVWCFLTIRQWPVAPPQNHQDGKTFVTSTGANPVSIGNAGQGNSFTFNQSNKSNDGFTPADRKVLQDIANARSVKSEIDWEKLRLKYPLGFAVLTASNRTVNTLFKTSMSNDLIVDWNNLTADESPDAFVITMPKIEYKPFFLLEHLVNAVGKIPGSTNRFFDNEGLSITMETLGATSDGWMVLLGFSPSDNR
jgi:hypothetical protein